MLSEKKSFQLHQSGQRVFIEAYKITHPKDSVKPFGCVEMECPAFDGFTIQAKYTIMHGGHPADEEKQAWSRVEAVINEFKSADKYLFSSPCGFPASP